MVPSSLVCNLLSNPFAHFYVASAEMDDLGASGKMNNPLTVIIFEIFLPQSHASQ